MKENLLTALDFLKKHKRMFITLGLVLFSFIIMLFSSHGLLKRYDLNSKNEDLLLKISYEKHIRDSIQHRIKSIRADINEIERIAREFYGMKKPNEKIYLFKEKTDTNTEE